MQGLPDDKNSRNLGFADNNRPLADRSPDEFSLGMKQRRLVFQDTITELRKLRSGDIEESFIQLTEK